jgi:DNA-binding transcriptional MerR regulator
MYQPGEVSQLLGVPASTIRRYSALVADFLSPGAHKRKRIYNDQDLTILARVRDLANQGVPLQEIPLQLAATIERGEFPKSALALPGLIEKIDQVYSRFEDQEAQLRRLSDSQVETERRLQALWEWSQLPWWKKLFRRPPE